MTARMHKLVVVGRSARGGGIIFLAHEEPVLVNLDTIGRIERAVASFRVPREEIVSHVTLLDGCVLYVRESSMPPGLRLGGA